jgi:hypothetical protein
MSAALAGAWRGLYTNWCKRHKPECGQCNPDLAQEIDEKHESKAEARSNDLYDTSEGTWPQQSLAMPCVPKLLMDM